MSNVCIQSVCRKKDLVARPAARPWICVRTKWPRKKNWLFINQPFKIFYLMFKMLPGFDHAQPKKRCQLLFQFSASGRRYLSTEANKPVCLWNLAPPRSVPLFCNRPRRGGRCDSHRQTITFTPTGKLELPVSSHVSGPWEDRGRSCSGIPEKVINLTYLVWHFAKWTHLYPLWQLWEVRRLISCLYERKKSC